MRIFVAGATGAIGRPLLRELVAAGHHVVGTTRSPVKVAAIAAAGAEPVVCDALDKDDLAAVVVAAKPDVVVHEMTALPPRYNPRKLERLYRATDRLHAQGTDNLLHAARAARAAKVVVHSVAFAYERSGSRTKTEDAPLDPNPPGALRDATAALHHLEHATASATGLQTVVLRYGFFYGPGTWYAPDGHFAAEARRRRYPIVGHGRGVFSFVHVDDAASATQLAIERDVAGVFNIVDAEPAEMNQWLPVVAAAIGAPRPWRAPAWAARLVAGRSAVEQLLTIRGADNAKARALLGWELEFPTWRTGFAAQAHRAADAAGTSEENPWHEQQCPRTPSPDPP